MECISLGYRKNKLYFTLLSCAYIRASKLLPIGTSNFLPNLFCFKRLLESPPGSQNCFPSNCLSNQVVILFLLKLPAIKIDASIKVRKNKYVNKSSNNKFSVFSMHKAVYKYWNIGVHIWRFFHRGVY